MKKFFSLFVIVVALMVITSAPAMAQTDHFPPTEQGGKDCMVAKVPYTPSITNPKPLAEGEVVIPNVYGACAEMKLPDRLGGRGFVFVLGDFIAGKNGVRYTLCANDVYKLIFATAPAPTPTPTEDTGGSYNPPAQQPVQVIVKVENNNNNYNNNDSTSGSYSGGEQQAPVVYGTCDGYGICYPQQFGVGVSVGFGYGGGGGYGGNGYGGRGGHDRGGYYPRQPHQPHQPYQPPVGIPPGGSTGQPIIGGGGGTSPGGGTGGVGGGGNTGQPTFRSSGRFSGGARTMSTGGGRRR
jgi:hypothetical protein